MVYWQQHGSYFPNQDKFQLLAYKNKQQANPRRIDFYSTVAPIYHALWPDPSSYCQY